MSGKFTAILGERLKKSLENYEVYYDHGDTSSRIPVYYGEYSRRNILSFVDIVVVKGDDVKIICEIEETTSTPKKVIGDLVSILLGEKIRCDDRELPISSPHVIIGLNVKEKGVKRFQISRMIERFSDFFKVDPEKIILIYSNDLNELIKNVEKAIAEILES